MEQTIKIGVDGRLLQGNLTGVGKYVLNLLINLCENDKNIKVYVFTNRPVSKQLNNSGFTILMDRHVFFRIKPMIWSKFLSHLIINKENIDIYFSGDGFIPFYLKVKKIISVVHDFVYILAPETMSNLHLLTTKLFFRNDVLKATYLIANSYGTAEKVLHYYKRTVDVVVYPVIDKWYKILDAEEVNKRLASLNISFPYILTVATQEPRKNLEKTIKAFLSLKEKKKIPLHKLLLIGSKGWKSQHLKSLFLGNRDIIELGYISDDTMPFLYNGADLFVFPSIYEGFGIPPREALLCGTKVVVSDIPELREATFNIGTYVDPERTGDFENSILASLNSVSCAPTSEITFHPNTAQIHQLLSLLYA